jgi:CRISPR-associated protein Csb3
MSTFVMRGADPHVLLHHMAFYGLADILDGAGVEDVRLVWDGGRPTISGKDLSPQIVDEAVREHVTGRRSWADRTFGAEKRGLMSPRLTVLTTEAAWQELHHGREQVLDELTDQQAWPDLRYLAALGEPCYWSVNPEGKRLQDDGASRLEMQPRNRGSEFVGNRLRKLSEKLLARKPGHIAAGLDGSRTVDELGGKPDSVSATGLTTPGPVDNALVWCALFGIGQFPIAMRIKATAITSGHLGRSRREWFYVPVWEGAWRLARLRSILACAQLHRAAAIRLAGVGGDDLDKQAAATWVRARGVVGVLRFPIGRFGSDNAPERRALRAQAVSLADPR